MSLALVYSRGQAGIDAPEVCVEVHLANGLPSLAIVGLPETAVKESKDRVRAALINCGFDFPTQRITVNLAPADLPKEGGRFDLAIALGILAASQQIPANNLSNFEFLGELSLSGELRPFRGALPAALQCKKSGRTMILPTDNSDEAALVQGLEVLPAHHLLEVCAHLQNRQLLSPHPSPAVTSISQDTLDYAEVRGQYQAKRAMEVAAAGGHNLLMIGPPGSGKSMLAQRLPTILPPLTEEQALESAAIASISGLPLEASGWRRPPFRAPHHTASAPALVGGGGQPKPGEISLAHNGVLFLDELPEFNRKVLEVLREPLENGHITISRAAHQAHFPARFQLIAAMNPCPCGYHGDPSGCCHCTPEQIRRYRERISGPLLDRIDIHIEVLCQTTELLDADHPPPLASSEMRARVANARKIALDRCGKLNAHLSVKEIDQFCLVEKSAQTLLAQAVERLGLSHRAFHRVLKMARTIADLDHNESISIPHISEAIGYRKLDRSPLQTPVASVKSNATS
ncbi:MAG: ATP-dependent protease [Methylothermaceae bacteria B42]|nr:MAG: ATP-dependent protease [Methylothermaceae bacteria B42]HHJ38129.1 ATP-dependent protease [Methylothermaceae bacterium]